MTKITQIVAMRGRNPSNPSDRRGGTELQQRLEPNSQGISNCITTVEKDNLVLESSVLRMVRTDEGKKLRKAYESKEIKYGFNEYREPKTRPDGLCNSITTVQKDNLIMQTQQINIRQATKSGYIPFEIGGVFDGGFPNSKTRRGRVQENGNVCPTITAQGQELYKMEMCECNEPGAVILYMPATDTYYQVRIRKLTPRECLRLMAVKDDEINRILEVNSNTQAYKQAGNSIVVDCMTAMFSQLGIENIEKWNEAN